MIPYDDLVAALARWRARQGLPVAAPAPAVVAPPPPPPPAPAPRAASAPPPRTAPPVAPPRAAAPPPLASPDVEVDDAALLDEAHYDSEGNDYALSFPHGEAEHTAVGVGPPRGSGNSTVVDDPSRAPPRSRNRNDDW